MDFEVNEGSFCVSLYRQEEAATADYTREIMAKGLKLYDCAFNEARLLISKKVSLFFLKATFRCILGVINIAF